MTSHREAAGELERVLFEIKRVIVGQDHMVERLIVALLARGHVLLEGLPGLAKTLAVQTLADTIGGSFVRLQFTPDLLPSDLVGTRIWRTSNEQFDIEWGPVFANLVLTDEINRAPAKVQSALLEVMAEHQVSIGGVTRPLPEPFLVLATQNPVESEGVYTLPEAQRDRFLMKVVVGYPSPAEELEIVRRMGVRAPSAAKVLDLEELQAFQDLADQVYVDNAVAQYAVDLVMATREPSLRGMPELQELIEFGVSPRATLGLVSAGRALALLRGRSYALPQDIFDVTRDVFRHRLMLSYEALAKGLGPDDVLNRLLAVVPAVALSPVELETKANASLGRSPAPAPGTRPAYAPDPRPAPPAGFPNAAPGAGAPGPGAGAPPPVSGAPAPPAGFGGPGSLGGGPAPAPSGAPAPSAGAPAPAGAPTPGGRADAVDTSPFPAPGRPAPDGADRPDSPPAERA